MLDVLTAAMDEITWELAPGSVEVRLRGREPVFVVSRTAWTDVHADGPLGDCELDMASGQVQCARIAALRARPRRSGSAMRCPTSSSAAPTAVSARAPPPGW